MKKSKIYEMVLFATFSGITLLLALVPNLGYWTFLPGISITIVHIPVLIGIMLLSFWYAVGLGAVFGISSLIASFMYASNPGDLLFQNPLISIVPRIIFAAVAFLVILGLKKIQTKQNGTTINFIIVLLVSSMFVVIGIAGLYKVLEWKLMILIPVGVLFWILLTLGYSYFLFKSKHKHLAYVPSSMIVSSLVHSALVLTMMALVKPDIFGEDIFYVILSILMSNSIVEALAAVLVGSPVVFAISNLRGDEYVVV